MASLIRAVSSPRVRYGCPSSSNLFFYRWHLILGAAVNNLNVAGTQAQSRAGGINRCVAATHYHHALSRHDRFLAQGYVTQHLDTVIYPLLVFTVDAQAPASVRA